MNAERLHAIAASLAADLRATKTVETLGSLGEALENQVNQPNQPQHQESVATHWRTLQEALERSATNSYSPAWLQSLQELGAYDLTGARLASRIDEVFARNQITPAVARDELTTLHGEVQALRTNADQLVAGLQGLAVGAEELEPGTAELGVLVPRGAVSNDLHSFGRELQRLDRTFGVFAELATTTQEGFQIRTISSSDLSVYLEALPQVAACAAVAVERVVALYKKILEIRRLKSELAEQGVPEESLEGVLTHADDHMKEGLKPVVEELLDEYYEGKDKKRLNELRTYLQSSLNEIANRIDKGYHIEVRVEPPEQADAEADDGDEQAFKYIQAIQDAQPGLQFFRTEGDPILRLLEGTDADAPSEDDKKDGKDKKSD